MFRIHLSRANGIRSPDLGLSYQGRGKSISRPLPERGMDPLFLGKIGSQKSMLFMLDRKPINTDYPVDMYRAYLRRIALGTERRMKSMKEVRPDMFWKLLNQEIFLCKKVMKRASLHVSKGGRP